MSKDPESEFLWQLVEQLVQNRSNAEKTADYIRDDGDNSRLLSRTDVS